MILNSDLDIRGLEKFSLVEWPGKIAAIIFTGGCNFRCPFCHNPELINITDKETPPRYPLSEIEKFLSEKIGWVDAIMVTGGEPTIQTELPNFLEHLKNKGYLCGVATNGTNPEMLGEIIEKKIIDRVCMDIKSNLKKYPVASGLSTGSESSASFIGVVEKIKKSISLLKKSPIDYELHLTIVPGLIDKSDICEIGELVQGTKKIVLQQFRPLKTLDKSYQNKVPYCKDEIITMGKELEKYVEEVDTSFIDN